MSTAIGTGSRSASAPPRSRLERDSLGTKAVPARALYGIFTERARETFALTGQPPHPALLRGYARIKRAAAVANGRLGLLPPRWVRAIVAAADEVIAGRLDDVRVLDALQAGAGTPTHMNVNEVLANVANERLGGRRGRWQPIHPNNHVNLGQSSNDVTPTAVRLMALELREPLLAEVDAVVRVLRRLARGEARTVKPGRTHLQDAVPITYGQVFGGWANALASGGAALRAASDELRVIALGGTAVGTGITAHPRFAATVARELSRLVRVRMTPAPNPATTIWSLRPFAACSAALRGLALDVTKICMDLRLLASGPHTGLAEIVLPEVEPGSSIMPGKVNPSIPEAVQMACYAVSGRDHTVALAAAAGELELNVMTPLVAWSLGESFDLLTRALALLRGRCLDGLRVDRARVRALVEGSVIEATGLSPVLGYEVTAELVKEAIGERRSLRDVVRRHGLLDAPTLARLLAPEMLTRPSRPDPAVVRRVQASAPYRAYRREKSL
ncbi:MAG: aspartate ammonia-lyase [Candidatus Rokubacteria bacterium]|nr:aspartate ammonia-lyase [Candidatus Rokubacteria bacterium]